MISMWTQKDWNKKPSISGNHKPVTIESEPESGYMCVKCQHKGPCQNWHSEVAGEPADVCPKCGTEEEPAPSVKCSCGQWAGFQKSVGNEEMFAWVYKCECGEYWSD